MSEKKSDNRKPFRNYEKYFLCHVKDLVVLEVFKVLSWHFGNVEKWLQKKATDCFKIYGTTDWTIDHNNTHIAQYIKK